jgi:multidrug resistance efflux pump
MRNQIFLFFTWVVAISLLISITFYHQLQIDKFVGITTAKEHIVNFSYPVEIKRLSVISGQKVKKGEVLGELIRFDVASEIEILNQKILELEGERRVNRDSISSEIKNISSNFRIDSSRLKVELKKLEIELRENRELLKTLLSTTQNSFKTLEISIDGLKSRIEDLELSFIEQKSYLKQKLKDEDGNFIAQINSLKEELKMLKVKEEKLTILSPIDGVIGEIFLTENSQLKPFEPLFKIYLEEPEFVVGYIHEDLETSFKERQKVLIRDVENEIFGYIESIENRVEDIPMELRKYQNIALRGYKVIVAIEKNSSLKLGKRVSINRTLEASPIENLFRYLGII